MTSEFNFIDHNQFNTRINSDYYYDKLNNDLLL